MVPTGSGNPYDAMFTPLDTMAVVPGTVQGTVYADLSLIPAHLTGPTWRWCRRQSPG